MSQKKNNNPFEKVLNEFFATNSFSNPKNASSWESNMIRWPHGATTNSGTFENNFMNMARMEDEASKAPPIKPFPLDFINDDLVKIYTDLVSLRTKLKQTLKFPNIGGQDKKTLQKEIENTTKMIDFIQEMFYNIENISL